MDREVIEQKLASLQRCSQRASIVHSIVKNHLGDFSEFARIMAARLFK